MITKECVLTNETGLHARPATAIAKKVAGVSADVTIEAKGKTANAKSLIGILSLGISKGDTVKVTVDGDNEEAICTELTELLASIHD